VSLFSCLYVYCTRFNVRTERLDQGMCKRRVRGTWVRISRWRCRDLFVSRSIVIVWIGIVVLSTAPEIILSFVWRAEAFCLVSWPYWTARTLLNRDFDKIQCICGAELFNQLRIMRNYLSGAVVKSGYTILILCG